MGTDVVGCLDDRTLDALLVGGEVHEQVTDAGADRSGQAVGVDGGELGNAAVQQVGDDALTHGGAHAAIAPEGVAKAEGEEYRHVIRAG